MHRIEKIIMSSALVLGMTVASPAFAAPQPGPGTSPSGAYLGVMVDKVSPETAASLHLATGGTSIADVDQDGPACQAGLKGGDIVTAFNGKPVSGPEQFAALIQGSAPGTTVTLTVWRGGHSQDMKVKLGDWKQMAAMPPPPPPRAPLSPVGTMTPMPPVAAMPPFDVPGFSPLLARSGILVEPLSTQLGEFFGVPQNEGVLVRSVDKGSPGASAGLKAGDVVVKVNNEIIHDMQDWKRALKTQGGKLTLSIVRDKRQQTLQMSVPASTSKLQGGEWESFGQDMEAMAAEMEKLRPEIERSAQEMAWLNPQQVDEIRRQAEASARTMTPEMKQQVEEIRKQSAQLQVQAEQMSKEMATMTPEMERAAREMAESMKPTAKELSEMTRTIEQRWKQMQPEIEKQMREFRKEMEKQQREWEKSLKRSNPTQL